MKKLLAAVFAVGCFAGAVYAGQPAATGINFSDHDMNIYVGPNADSMARVCVFCHTPHNALKDASISGYAYPLWNHEFSVATFSPYVWATPDNYAGGAFEILDPVAGPSRLCLSCHDGSIAVDQHGRALEQAGTTPLPVGSRANLTNDLTDDHPIGFDYVAIRIQRNAHATVADPTTGDTEVVDPAYGFATAVVTSDVSGVYNAVTRGDGITGKRITDVLYGGTIMTCASCHEVHNKENAIQDPYVAGNQYVIDNGLVGQTPNYFLWAKQTDSLICLSCHVK